MTVTVGLTADSSYTVGPDDTSVALGSGEVAVLATPRLLAWFEAVSLRALEDALDEAETSVGTRASVEHVSAAAVGATVAVRAEVTEVDGRLVELAVLAEDGEGRLLGHGTVTRVTLDRERFLARVPTP